MHASTVCYVSNTVKWLAVCLLVLTAAAFMQQAAAATYSASTVAATGFDTTTTAVVWEGVDTGYPGDDDQQLVNLGFTFYLGSVAYTQVRILTNGALHFGANQGFHKYYQNEALAITGSYNGPGFEEPADRAILPYWDDLMGSGVGSITYGTLGSAPNRRFVVTWQGVWHYPNTGSYTFQAVLYEASGEILFRYGAGNANGSSATIGVEVDDSDFSQYSFNSSSVSAANDILFSPTFPVINAVTASCTNYNEVVVDFQSPVHPAFAANAAYYSIDNGISVTSATVTGANTVTLQTSTMSTGTTYTLQTLQPLLQNVKFDVLSTVVETYRDEFNAVNYTNNNGSLNWATNWTEINESDGPNNGDERITGDRLRIQDNDGGGEGVERAADLSSFTSATLSYLYQRDRLDNINDYVTVSIWNDGTGASPTPLGWVELVRHSGDPPTDRNDGSNVAVTPIDITPYMSTTTDTRIRFLSSPTLGGNDRVYFDDIEIQGTTSVTCAASGGPDHFAIVHDGTGVTCQAELVTVTAHKANDDVEAGYTGTLNLTTSTSNGDWSVFSGSGVLTPAGADSGSASYVFDSADNGVLQLLLKDTHVEAVNINVFDISSGATETSGSALPAEDLNLAFTETGFRFIDAADVPIIGTQIAGKESATAPNPQSLYLQAIRASDDGSTCNGVFADGTTVNVDLGSSCSNPVSCLAGQRVSVTNNGITTAIANPQNQDAGLNYSSVPLTFITNSRAPLVLNYADAGEIQLNARYTIPLGTGAPSGNLMIGNSNAFVVRPFGFDMDFSGQRAADYLDDGLLNNSTGANDSYAVDASGSVFQIAGADFPLTLRALVWDSTDDADFNGEPDACANLTDNATTQNFGSETTAIVPSDVTLGHTLVEPVAGVAGTLTTSANSVSFASGVGSKTISWNEVGVMDQDVTLTSYLGAGQDVLGNVCNVGRFYPNNFVINNIILTNRSDVAACPDPFTYMAENFSISYDLQATSVNPPGSITQNYINSFAKLDPAVLADMNYGATDSGTNLTARLAAASAGVFTAGAAPVTATLSFSRNATPDGVYNNLQIGIVPTDSDGVTLLLAALDLSLDGGPNTHNLLGQTDIRYGRLNLQNNFGSELLTLTMPLSAEYYLNATAEFITNIDDNCTTRTTADILLYNDQQPKVGRVPGNRVININGASNTTLTGVSAFVAGRSLLTFTAPGAEGYVDVEVQTPSWLKSALDGIDQGIQGPGMHCHPGLAGSDPAYIAGCVADGNSVDETPLSRGNFGLFKGGDNIIYIREIY